MGQDFHLQRYNECQAPSPRCPDDLLKEVRKKARETDDYAKLIQDHREVLQLQKKAFQAMIEFFNKNKDGSVSNEVANNAVSVATDALKSLKKD